MKPGSIEDIVARLTLWGRRAPKGLARVEFDSEFARRRVVNGLQLALAEAGIPFHEIELPARTPAARSVLDLVERLTALASGVVSISGFATAFPDDIPLEDSLRIFNFNRENLARPAVCQIWWMPTHFAEKFIRAVPDLNSWFMVRLRLTEVVPPPFETQPTLEQPGRLKANLEDARKRAANLVERFERALAAGVSAKELRQNLALPAVSALLEGGAEKEARELALTLAQKIAQAAIRPPAEASRADFFISYASADGKWAEWIAYQLEEAGYSTVIQAWDFRPGANFVLEMQEAASACERTIAVLSPHYLSSKFAAAEWAAAFATDPTGKERTLVPVRVAPCEPQGLLGPIVYIDLVGLDETTARDRLLSRIGETRAKPGAAPEYPGKHIPAKLPTAERPEFPSTLPSLWNVPYPRNPFFTGREKVLEQLHAALASRGAAALSGLGGIGKTQTAVEYAYRHRNDYNVVLWAKADSREALVSDFVAIADVLNLPGRDAQDQNLVVASVKRWLEVHTDWLLILDNADDLAIAREFIPSGRGHILFTTRTQATGAIAQRVEIDKMESEEGALFLLRRAKIIAENAAVDVASAADRTQAEEIAKELDGLPLALDQAGAYIEETACGLSDYLSIYRTHGIELLKRRGMLASDHPDPVATTWTLSFEKVEQASPAAAELLRLCAFFHPDAIPEELITEGAPELGPVLQPVAADAHKLNTAIAELLKYSLLRRDPIAKTLDIHRLVQAVLKGGMDEATQRQWAERTVRAVNRTFPSVQFPEWPLCERLLPHAQACVELIGKWNLEFQEAARLLNRAALYLHDRARFSEAEPLYQRALAIREKALGPDHPDVAQSLNNLAALYRAQGRYTEAEPFYQRALAIVEKALGPDHPDVATSLNSLAELYHAQGRHAEAEPLYQRALVIREKVLGPDHPDVALSLNNLAAFYYIQKKYTEAEPLYQRALVIREKVLGPDHPDVANSLNNLAALYYIQGKDAEAERLYRRTLTIREKALGPDHPNVATSLGNLAVLYNAQGKYAQAEPLFQRSLAIKEKILGPGHPEMATPLENYAALLRKTNRETEADKLEARAQAIRTKHAQENPTK